jgi:hypothetical protein
MVESSQDIQAGLLDAKLDKEWMALALSQKTTKEFLESSVKRVAEDGNLVAFFNQRLVRLFLANDHEIGYQ